MRRFRPLSQLSVYSVVFPVWSKVPFVLLLPRKHRQFCSHSFADRIKNEAVHFLSTQPTLRIFILYEELASGRKKLSSTLQVPYTLRILFFVFTRKGISQGLAKVFIHFLTLHWFAQRAHIVHPAIAGPDEKQNCLLFIHSANSPCILLSLLIGLIFCKQEREYNTIYTQVSKVCIHRGLFVPPIAYTN